MGMIWRTSPSFSSTYHHNTARILTWNAQAYHPFSLQPTTSQPEHGYEMRSPTTLFLQPTTIQPGYKYKMTELTILLLPLTITQNGRRREIARRTYLLSHIKTEKNLDISPQITTKAGQENNQNLDMHVKAWLLTTICANRVHTRYMAITDRVGSSPPFVSIDEKYSVDSRSTIQNSVG